MKEITEQEELEEVMENAGDKLVIVDFWASWCGPCRMIGPIYNQLSEDPEFKNDVIFVKADVDESSDMAEELGVKVMPTFFFFKNGKKLEQVSGSNKASLVDMIRKYK